jgi:hypothetical protein
MIVIVVVMMVVVVVVIVPGHGAEDRAWSGKVETGFPKKTMLEQR